MNINNKEDITDIIQAYHKQDINLLSKNIKNFSKRINFEEWLLDKNSSHLTNQNFDWTSKVIALICNQIVEDSKESIENKEKEDLLLTNLISQLPFFPDTDRIQKNHFANQTVIVNGLAENIFNYSRIQGQITDNHLPSTCKALLSKMLGQIDYQVIFEEAMIQNNFSMLKAMIDITPNEFKAALKRQNPQNGLTSLYKAVSNNNIKLLKFLAEAAPQDFKEAFKIADNMGGSPLRIAIYNNNLSIVQLLAEAAPEEFKEIFKRSDYSGGFDLIFMAVCKNNIKMLTFLEKVAPDEFKTSLNRQDSKKERALFEESLKQDDTHVLEFLLQFQIEKFKLILKTKNEKHQTLLHQLVDGDLLEMLQFIAEKAPNELKEGLKITDKEGWTPLHTSVLKNNMKMLKFLIEKSPDAVNIISNQGYSVLSLLKASRPDNYHEITKFFKNNRALKEHYKTQFSRKALSHAWKIAGVTHLVRADTKENFANLSLEGHRSPEWFHLMRKNLNEFKASYPDLLSETQTTLLKQLFDLGANSASYPAEERINRMRAGLPIIVNAGFSNHGISLLIWGNQFIICNRGGASRFPIEAFHFDPLQFNSADIENIEKIASAGTRKNYEQFFFNTLSTKLNFSKNELDQEIQKITLLPPQSIGNCSFESPITGVCAFMLIGMMRGIDSEGCLLEETAKQLLVGSSQEDTKDTWTQLAIQAISMYQTWLSNLQISILEKNIQLLKEDNLYFEPDRQLITQALRKAHLLPLDEKCQKKLDTLTEIYLHSLDQEEKVKLKSDLIYWKSLIREVLL